MGALGMWPLLGPNGFNKSPNARLLREIRQRVMLERQSGMDSTWNLEKH